MVRRRKKTGQGKHRSSEGQAQSRRQRSHAYRQLTHPYTPQRVFSEDVIAAIHHKSLRLLEKLGVKMLLPEARQIFREAGARIDEAGQMVFIGREIIDHATASAPPTIRLRAPDKSREQNYEPGSLLFMAGSGCPNVTDLVRGRRAGSLRDFEETTKLQQSFDAIHLLSPSAEPQDIAANLRHYEMTRIQLTRADKPMFVYARGRGQVSEAFELMKLGLSLGEDEFTDGVWANTVINTNSPRQIDIPMAEGIIDFARAGQMSIITPFCLAGAMAPVTIAGALVLQHAECLAAIALAQLSKPGAPVSYGGFSSNVDMKSGSPAFGTPEHVKLSIGTGQLARYIGLPWRSAAGSASNVADMQSSVENSMGLWGALQANATLIVHAAGWLEGGLTFSYEKFINDMEAVQTLAELAQPTPDDDDSLAWSALADVQPGGHFFATDHTMQRYREAFYQPLVADLSNHGAWQEAGAKTSSDRSTALWQQVLDNYSPPDNAGEIGDRIAARIELGIQAGGQAPSGG